MNIKTYTSTTNNIKVFSDSVLFKTKKLYSRSNIIDPDRVKIRNVLNRVQQDYDLAFKKLAKE